MSLKCQLKSKAFCISGLYQSVAPPHIPLKNTHFERYSSLLRGARGYREDCDSDSSRRKSWSALFPPLLRGLGGIDGTRRYRGSYTHKVVINPAQPN